MRLSLLSLSLTAFLPRPTIAEFKNNYRNSQRHPHAELISTSDPNFVYESPDDLFGDHRVNSVPSLSTMISLEVENQNSSTDDDESFLQMYDNKCNNGIVGLFCQGYGCYYSSDCFDGYCNMYSKCDKRARPAFISDLERQLSNAVEGLDQNAANSTAADLADGSKNSTESQQAKSSQPSSSPLGVPSGSSMPTNEELQKEHFKGSPFQSAEQLNSFLFWFGIVSALLMMAFIIQCCREIAKGEDIPPSATAERKATTPLFSNIEDPLARMNQTDPRSLLSNGQSTEDKIFQNKAYLMHTKQKSQVMGVQTPQALQYKQDTEKLNRKFYSANSQQQFRSGQQQKGSEPYNSFQGFQNGPTNGGGGRNNSSGIFFDNCEFNKKRNRLTAQGSFEI